MILHLLTCTVLAPLGAAAALIAGCSVSVAILAYAVSGGLGLVGSAATVALLGWLRHVRSADLMTETVR